MSCGPFALQRSRGRFFAIHLLPTVLGKNLLHQDLANSLCRAISISLSIV